MWRDILIIVYLRNSDVCHLIKIPFIIIFITGISINDKPNIELPRSQNWSNSICINPTRSQKVLFIYSLCLITETMSER